LATRATFSAKMGRVANLQLHSDLAIKSLTAVDWRDSFGTQESIDLGLVDAADTLDAPSLSSLKITGKTGVSGDFAADLNITGDATKTNLSAASIAGGMSNSLWTISGGLRTLTVKGAVIDSAVRTTGSMKSVTLGSANGSDFLAGIDGAVIRHATLNTHFLNTLASIGSFKVVGTSVPLGEAPPRFFVDSNISAAKVGTASLANMQIDNGSDTFGIFVKDIVGLGEVKSVSSNDTLTGWSWTWKPRLETGFVLQDFVVQVIT
jgi:hypothetical protein